MDSPHALGREDYQIGVICALPVEQAAVIAALDDDEHPGLTPMSGDDNQYTFGRIKGHNIVVACLPAGHMGTANACNVATNMQRSFPIKFGLMVGIAGGVWSEENDVHLGDVVVGQPKGQFGGVVQYDFGKTEKDGSFKRTSSLNEPPKVLLHSLQSLQTKHLRKGNGIMEVLAAMFEKESHMVKLFGYPGAALDQLFDASYDHEGGPNNCKRCDPSRVPQDWEPRDTPDPQIHYGTIASANQLMRHGPTRDKVAKDLGAIAFEMEAAGLMNHFPCLVIRGICDYADTHKNKRWQGYAAATAAAFTKELLGFIPKQEVVKMQPACESSHILPYVVHEHQYRCRWTQFGSLSRRSNADLKRRLVKNEHWIVPRGSSALFTGRANLIHEVGQQLCPASTQLPDKQRRFVFVGVGGIGKSEICLKLAETLREMFVLCFVVAIVIRADNLGSGESSGLT
jgi:nucleoside phosphorylase